MPTATFCAFPKRSSVDNDAARSRQALSDCMAMSHLRLTTCCLVKVNRGTQRSRTYRNHFGAGYAGTGADLHAVPAGWQGEPRMRSLLAAASVAPTDVLHPQQLAVLVEHAQPAADDAALAR